MTALEKQILSDIESKGIECIKENSDLWNFLNKKRNNRIIPNVSRDRLEEVQEGIPSKLKFHGYKLIKEGTIGTCHICGSTEIKRFIWFGESIGCIKPECKNYYK